MLPERLLFKLLDVMKVGLTYIDEEQKIVYLNNEASEALNIDVNQMIGHSVTGCHPEETHPAVLQKISSLKESSRGEWHKIVERGGRFLENYYSSVFING